MRTKHFILLFVFLLLGCKEEDVRLLGNAPHIELSPNMVEIGAEETTFHVTALKNAIPFLKVVLEFDYCNNWKTIDLYDERPNTYVIWGRGKFQINDNNALYYAINEEDETDSIYVKFKKAQTGFFDFVNATITIPKNKLGKKRLYALYFDEEVGPYSEIRILQNEK